MYKQLIRPILYSFNPEHIHDLLVKLLPIWAGNRVTNNLFTKLFSIYDKKLETNVLGINFPNPVGLAAGFDKNASLLNCMSMFGFGFVEIGTVTPKAQPGNPTPRLFRITADEALINRMGFNNKGVELAVENIKKARTSNPTLVIGGNLGKNTSTPNAKAVNDYLYCFHALYDHVDYLVLNISCPNIKDLDKLADTENLALILKRIKDEQAAKLKYKPILLKLSPDHNEAEIDAILALVQQYNIDGIVATNTSRSRNKLKTNKQKLSEIGDGGLSGKPLRERSTATIRYIHQKTQGKLPIIGVGGIFTPEDALEKIEAGASLVQLYSGWIYEGPGLVKKINRFILNKLKNNLY